MNHYILLQKAVTNFVYAKVKAYIEFKGLSFKTIEGKIMNPNAAIILNETANYIVNQTDEKLDNVMEELINYCFIANQQS